LMRSAVAVARHKVKGVIAPTGKAMRLMTRQWEHRRLTDVNPIAVIPTKEARRRERR
jgi:hypothetical protein